MYYAYDYLLNIQFQDCGYGLTGCHDCGGIGSELGKVWASADGGLSLGHLGVVVVVVAVYVRK